MSARRIAAAFACAIALAACGPRTPFKGIDVTGSPIGDDLGLLDPDGKTRTLTEFRGKVVIVVFGYTQCPDVCPTTLADFASAMKKLGPDAAGVQLLFVTLDPKRDAAPLLRQYVPAFDPSFVGLRGDAAATSKVTKDFRVYSQERAGKTADTYTVDHSAQSFVFDRKGKVRLIIGFGAPPEAIASDLRVLLNS